MDVSDHITTLRRDGELLAAAAESAHLDAPIPACPGWNIRDLLRHAGSVHRWATAHVARRLTAPIESLEDAGGPWPDDAVLLDWFRQGHAELVRSLEQAEPDLECWSFFPAPSPLAFWARRQAHETGIHRADAESASGTITPFAPSCAVDGIDELLFCFASRPGGRLRGEELKTLHIHATDIEGDWLIHIGPEGVHCVPGHADADCTVMGLASDLYLLLWNRREASDLDVHGDRVLMDHWRDSVKIRWA